jgi:hypothetical protein
VDRRATQTFKNEQQGGRENQQGKVLQQFLMAMKYKQRLHKKSEYNTQGAPGKMKGAKEEGWIRVQEERTLILGMGNFVTSSVLY